jgi:hypothetical protein
MNNTRFQLSLLNYSQFCFLTKAKVGFSMSSFRQLFFLHQFCTSGDCHRSAISASHSLLVLARIFRTEDHQG